MASIIIRDADFGDVKLCQKIEKSAAKRFLESDISAINILVDDVKMGAHILEDAIKSGLCFVSEIDNEAVGFIALKQFNCSYYIVEISVMSHAQSQGVGNALLAYVKMLAEINRIASLNLITFKDVDWNMPYYLKKGYKPLEVEHLSPQFAELWKEDTQHFNADLRVCMQLKIDINKF